MMCARMQSPQARSAQVVNSDSSRSSSVAKSVVINYTRTTGFAWGYFAL